MIVATFNVCGLGGRLKKNKIKELVRAHKIDFVVIQETKLEVITRSLCANLCGNEDFEWAFLPSEGNSGGILSIWKKSLSTLYYTFKGEGFVGVFWSGVF
jgi:exonuclease III